MTEQVSHQRGHDHEIAGARDVTEVATSITAFIGRTQRGPGDVPVVLTSFADFEDTFGGLWDGSTLGFSVRDFFLNGGATAVVVRLYRPDAGDSPRPARATLRVGTLTLEAAADGAWGNALQARVDTDIRAPDRGQGGSDPSAFTLQVRDGLTGVVEEHRDLVVSPTDHPRHVTTVLAAESGLVRATSTGANPPQASSNVVDAGRGVWDDNATPTHVTVASADAASDGELLTASEFVGPGLDAARRGLFALEGTDLFNLLVIAPHAGDGTVDPAVVRAADDYCRRRRAVQIVDGLPGWKGVEDVVAAFATGFDTVLGTSSEDAALFFPRLRQPNPLHGSQIETFPAAGAVAGVMARTDAEHGVWTAPAGLEAALNRVPALEVALTGSDISTLNPLGVNCLRSIPGGGRVVWGARTMQGSDQLASPWKYLSVRRTALFIEESITRGTRWVASQRNEEATWAQIRHHVGEFMHSLFREGAFPGGTTTSDAYFVACDGETTTQAEIDRGVVTIVVGFAPVKRAEFVIVRVQQVVGEPTAERGGPAGPDHGVREHQGVGTTRVGA